jgi:hypothetical protein
VIKTWQPVCSSSHLSTPVTSKKITNIPLPVTAGSARGRDDPPQENLSQAEQGKNVSVRYANAWRSLLSPDTINVFNMDLSAVLTGVGGLTVFEDSRINGTPQPEHYVKGLDINTCLPIYYPAHFNRDAIDVGAKNRAHLASAQPVARPDDILNTQHRALGQFDFLFPAIDAVILRARQTLQYAYVVAYYPKTSANSATSGKTKSHKQLFELQLKYLVEPTETLQSHLDMLTDDIVQVFWHKKAIISLIQVLTRMRKFLTDHVEGVGQGSSASIENGMCFEEALMYEPDTEMAYDIWQCQCKTTHPSSLAWCPTCTECRVHRELECGICWRR